MTAFGEKVPFEYVTCYNHTINLAVHDVIFPKTKKVKKASSATEREAELSGDVEEEAGSEGEAEEDCECEQEIEIHVVTETFSATIERMRAIINAFRKSPVKNGLLQAELKEQNMADLQLISFTKTRWNSLVISAKRFLQLLPAVRVVLTELSTIKLVWDDENTELLEVSFRF